MATNKVNLGIGLSTGMVFMADAGTALPSSPLDSLSADWKSIGAITADGITWASGKDSEPLRNWAKEVERLVASDEGGTVTAPLMYTDKATLEAIFGESNVTYTAATGSNGNITSVTVAPGVSASPKAFIFLMRDGDDAMMVGSSKAIIRDVSDITFAPTEAITWEVTIEASSWTFTKDDGQTVSGS